MGDINRECVADDPSAEFTVSSSTKWRLVVGAVLLALFVGLMLGKVTRDEPSGVATPGSITSARNDAMADYEAAIRSSKPVYVLFHSLS